MTAIRVDIVSDVMCPWCIIGFKQLEAACNQTGIGVEVHWHPFELNPDMPPEGQNAREHIIEKYGSTPEQSDAARAQMQALGTELGFTFDFNENSKMENSFRAHQLVHFAARHGLAHQTKMALFETHFTAGRNVNDLEVLIEVGAVQGLDAEALRAALTSGELTEPVRKEQRFWIEQGITGVPAMVFDGKFLVTGAQGVENYSQILQHVQAQHAA